MTDTRDVERELRQWAELERQKYNASVEVKYQSTQWRAAEAIAAERAARERAEADAQRWRESAAMLQHELDKARDHQYVHPPKGERPL